MPKHRRVERGKVRCIGQLAACLRKHKVPEDFFYRPPGLSKHLDFSGHNKTSFLLLNLQTGMRSKKGRNIRKTLESLELSRVMVETTGLDC